MIAELTRQAERELMLFTFSKTKNSALTQIPFLTMDEQSDAEDGNELSRLIAVVQKMGIELAELFTGMAISAYKEYTVTGKLESMNRAVVAAARSVKSTSYGSDKLGGWLNSYGVMLETRYERTSDVADLESAIEGAQQAVDSTPEDHPD